MIYLDNAATANPKAPGVAEAMVRSLTDLNANPGHGGHHLAVKATLEVFAARSALARLFGVPDPARLVFTAGATAALNQAITGSLPDGGGNVICSTWEHNAVLRPLYAWARRTGGTVTVLPAGPRDPLEPADVAAAIRPDTALIVLTAASNVTGALLPVAEVGEIARARGIRFVVDGAQAAGHLPLRLADLPFDLWACPGHKGLLGPQGVGVLYVRPGLDLEPLLYGGAGFDSERREQPEEAPERFEAGTLNTPGILGLGAAARHLLEQDLPALRQREVALQERLLSGLRAIPGVRLHGAAAPEAGVGVASVTIAGWTPSEAADALDRQFGICVRAGLHCAPQAHAALGTSSGGTVRFSLSPATTAAEIDAAIGAVAALAAREAVRGA